MRSVYGLFACFLSCSITLASEETYKAAIIETSTAEEELGKYLPFIYQAAKLNVDILVLPPSNSFSLSCVERSCGADNYDELVAKLSEASSQAGLYVVAHLLEKTRCQGKYELVRSNLVFGRDGRVVSIYRKPVNTVANCTTAPSEVATFTTDFGVKFGLMMEEDLVLQKFEDLKGVKNFVVTGGFATDVPFLSALHFASSWAFTNQMNVVTSSHAIAGTSGVQGASEAGLTIAKLRKAGGGGLPTPPIVSSPVFSSEDLSQYIIKPLDATSRRQRDTVCHAGFCCQFYVKTRSGGHKEDEASYGLAVFAGIRQFGKHNIGVQTCAVFACAGLYKRTCAVGSSTNNTSTVFERISIHSNFTSKTSQYPIFITTGSQSDSNHFIFETNAENKQVTLEATNLENVLTFGIFSRDFSKDSEREIFLENELSFKDEMQEMFDYLWIRLRVLIFVVSIYFLEMM